MKVTLGFDIFGTLIDPAGTGAAPADDWLLFGNLFDVLVARAAVESAGATGR